MKDFYNIEETNPAKINGKIYEVVVEIETTKFGKVQFIVFTMWDVDDWLLIPFAFIPGYKGMSGKEYFQTYKPKLWREY